MTDGERAGPLLHITSAEAWAAAQAAGVYAPPSLAREGFVHLSTPAQVLATAARYYAGQRGLVLLRIDAPEAAGAPLRWEDVGHGVFPHLYGPLPLAAVSAVLPFEPGPDGAFSLPPGAPSDR